MKRLCAECLGTFALVFTGTGAIVIDNVSHGTVTHVGIALTFGLIVMSLIYAVGDVSGAHVNPAVTVGFWAARRFAGRDVLPYVVSQLAGAIAASLTLRGLFPMHETLGATLPAGSVWQSFVLEIILAFLLMWVILCVTTSAKKKGISPGVAIGAMITLEALFAGPISGASMNPIRSLAPALVSGTLRDLWVYLSAPFLGAFLAVGACRCVQPQDCCCSSARPEVSA